MDDLLDKLTELEGRIAELQMQLATQQQEQQPMVQLGPDMEEIEAVPTGDPGLTTDSECATITGESDDHATKTLEINDSSDHSQFASVRLYGAATAADKKAARIGLSDNVATLEWFYPVQIDSDPQLGEAGTVGMVSNLQVVDNVLQQMQNLVSVLDGAADISSSAAYTDIVDFSTISVSHADSADTATTADNLAIDPETGLSTLQHDQLLPGADPATWADNDEHDPRYWRADDLTEDKHFKTSGDVIGGTLGAGNGVTGTYAVIDPATGNQVTLSFVAGVLTGAT